MGSSNREARIYRIKKMYGSKIAVVVSDLCAENTTLCNHILAVLENSDIVHFLRTVRKYIHTLNEEDMKIMNEVVANICYSFMVEQISSAQVDSKTKAAMLRKYHELFKSGKYIVPLRYLMRK